MSSRPEAEPVTPKGRRTRVALLKAGAVVAERRGLAGLSVAAVAEEAGVAKGTFYLYFADRNIFVDALHQEFYERVSEAVALATQNLPPGRELLLRAIDAYLDVCLENKAVKALVFETRAQGDLTTTMRQREEAFAVLAQPSLATMGIGPTSIASRLFVAMTSEAALIEMEAGHKVSGARDTIRALALAKEEIPCTQL
jgi:TetR/AcrR family transcriptional repressor of nem operon